LLISGSKGRIQATQFRIVTGHGCFVLPVKQKARVLSLALREAEILEECITNHGIQLKVWPSPLSRAWPAGQQHHGQHQRHRG
jgi:uncharacterized membrane protein YqiK